MKQRLSPTTIAPPRTHAETQVETQVETQAECKRAAALKLVNAGAQARRYVSVAVAAGLVATGFAALAWIAALFS